jgi:hypothetical protein
MGVPRTHPPPAKTLVGDDQRVPSRLEKAITLGRRARYETVVPNSAPTPAVMAIASAPQNPTRAAPTHAGAPPARAAKPPRATRQTSDTPDTTKIAEDGAATTARIGSAAPTLKVAADASAA